METLTRPARAGRRPRLSLALLRLAVTAHLLAVLTQPLLAGLFLTGDVDAIDAHATVGSALAALQLVVIGIAVTYAVGGGRLWVVAVAVAQFLVVGLQVGMGYARVLQVHVPLGVLLATAAFVLAFWAWTPAAARPRGGAR